MREDGEPISEGRRDVNVATVQALKATLFTVGIFTVVVGISGVLIIVLLEVVGVLAISP